MSVFEIQIFHNALIMLPILLPANIKIKRRKPFMILGLRLVTAEVHFSNTFVEDLNKLASLHIL